MASQGLFWVNSRVTSPKLSAETYNKWYEEEHIPELVATSGIKSGFRYKAVDPKEKNPFLAIYPLKDIAFPDSDEFKAVPTESKTLPGSGKVFDLADFDVRVYEHLQSFERPNAKPGRALCLMSAAIEPAEGGDEEFDEFYRKQHLDMLAMCDGYRKTTRYKLVSQQFVGPSADTTKNVETPRFLALHEFESPNLPMDQINQTASTEWAKKILGSVKIMQAPLFTLTKAGGQTDAKL
ncbi:MAG: hypothetical protein M1827_004284 [Pycnora praestabilis]|nr:MAG: hypothetical protein M1827_004284 [Pycnora praestabilis]